MTMKNLSIHLWIQEANMANVTNECQQAFEINWLALVGIWIWRRFIFTVLVFLERCGAAYRIPCTDKNPVEFVVQCECSIRRD